MRRARDGELHVLLCSGCRRCALADVLTLTDIKQSLDPTIGEGKNGGFGGRIQLINATDSLNISAGVWKPSVLRGLSFNCLAIALS